PLVAVDTGHRQIEVRVPHAAWDPGSQLVRLAAGVGLWDKANGRYLLPQAAADAAHPGGAGTAVSPAGFFNVAFRYDEPMPEVGDPTGTATGPAWWRDKHQGEALAAGDISALHADVDFAKLAAAVNDDMPGQPGGVPQTGPMDRILVSQFETGQGADFSVNCFPGSTSGGTNCPGQYQGVLQPYAIYVPSGPMPRQGYGMTLLLHSLSTNYNQYLGSRNQSQFGDRDGGSIVITPESRGPDGFYDSNAGADVFEVWADVARRYRLDPPLDYPALGFVADHAYWLSGIKLRSATPPVTGGHGQGSIDALSYGFGTGDPIPSDTQFGTGTLTGGNLPTPLVFTRQFRTWGPVPSIPRLRRIDLAARNITAVTINVRRANVGCGVDLHVDTDGPMTIELAGCGRTIAAGGGA